jgi:hypothetical protein
MQEKNEVISKAAIAVYNPQDYLERAIQDAFHEHNDGWLPMYACQLAAKALAFLKMFDENWIENTKLIDHRVKYFFAPFMSAQKDEMVFVTSLLFLRDILENKTINAFIHNPVVFVTKPIAHYLLREYPVHILFDMNKLYSINRTAKPVHINGLVIFDEENLNTDDAVLDIFTKNTTSGTSSVSAMDIEHIMRDTGFIRKVAVSLREPGVFRNDQDKRTISPQAEVWDKIERVNGKVVKVEPGETGSIEVSLNNGIKKIVSQVDFDKEFTLI